MSQVRQAKLEQVLKDNKEWPLVIVNAKAGDFADATIIPSSIAANDLYTGFESKPLLLIEELDNISEQEQEKFISLLKDRRMGSSKLPRDVQIIIPVKSKNSLSKKIQSLCLFWEL